MYSVMFLSDFINTNFPFLGRWYALCDLFFGTDIYVGFTKFQDFSIIILNIHNKCVLVGDYLRDAIW